MKAREIFNKIKYIDKADSITDIFIKSPSGKEHGITEVVKRVFLDDYTIKEEIHIKHNTEEKFCVNLKGFCSMLYRAIENKDNEGESLIYIDGSTFLLKDVRVKRFNPQVILLVCESAADFECCPCCKCCNCEKENRYGAKRNQ
jgi:hypothetical protein